MKKKLLLIFVFVLTLCVFTDVFAIKCDNGQDYVACGYGVNAVTGIPTFAPRLISFAIALMRILIPVVLIITGTIEMFKSIISGNQDNIAKGKKKLIGKYVGALLAFFIISFTTNIVKLIARGDEKSVAKACFNCFLNNKCNNTKLACQGTLEAKTDYINQKCGEYLSEEECPSDRCEWNSYSNVCIDQKNQDEKECGEFTNQSDCPLDRCSWGYNYSSTMYCYTPTLKCEDMLTASSCPTERCGWGYGEDGSSSQMYCYTKSR